MQSRCSASEINFAAMRNSATTEYCNDGTISKPDSRFLRATQNHLSHYTYVTAHTRRCQCQPGIYTVRRVRTRRIPSVFTHPRMYVQHAVSSSSLPSLPYVFSAHALGPCPWDTKESVSLRSTHALYGMLQWGWRHFRNIRRRPWGGS